MSWIRRAAAPDPTWRIGEDRAGAPGPRQRLRDPRHLRAFVARFRGSDPRCGRLGSGSRGLAAVRRTLWDKSPGQRPSDGEPACRRGSVRPRRGGVAIHLSGLPGDCPSSGRTGRPCPTFGLAPGGVYRAARVTPDAGALLPHRFTLACAGRSPPSAVCSLLHCPSGRPDWPLASTLPCGAPTFLDTVPA
jgi:hypothetical protein